MNTLASLERHRNKSAPSILDVKGARKMVQFIDAGAALLGRAVTVTTIWYDGQNAVMRQDQTLLVEPLPPFSLKS
jgi:hypothetical protein